MAAATVVPLYNMHLVAEFHIAGSSCQFVSYSWEVAGVALLTVRFDRESGLVVMTGSARVALLHICHAVAFIVAARDEYGGMAVLAAIGAQMSRVAEHGATLLEIDVLDDMTFSAALLNAKG